MLDSTPSVKEVLNETEEVTEWYSLGIRLDIKCDVLDQIERNYNGDAERCKTEVLKFWLRNTEERTWGRLAQAINQMGGHAILVQSLRETHPS